MSEIQEKIDLTKVEENKLSSIISRHATADDVLDGKKNLESKMLAVFESEMASQKKNLVPAYLFWFFLGSFGAHKFYLNNKNMGWIYVALNIVGLLTAILVIGFVFLAALGVMLIIDIFTIPSQVSKRNLEIERLLLLKLS